MNNKKKYLILVTLKQISDDIYGEIIISQKKYYRWAKSMKSAVSALRYTLKLYDYDNYNGSIAYKYFFDASLIEKEEPKYEQLSLFDF